MDVDKAAQEALERIYTKIDERVVEAHEELKNRYDAAKKKLRLDK